MILLPILILAAQCQCPQPHHATYTDGISHNVSVSQTPEGVTFRACFQSLPVDVGTADWTAEARIDADRDGTWDRWCVLTAIGETLVYEAEPLSDPVSGTADVEWRPYQLAWTIPISMLSIAPGRWNYDLLVRRNGHAVAGFACAGTPLVGDVDRDGRVDLRDLAVLQNDWTGP